MDKDYFRTLFIENLTYEEASHMIRHFKMIQRALYPIYQYLYNDDIDILRHSQVIFTTTNYVSELRTVTLVILDEYIDVFNSYKEYITRKKNDKKNSSS